jgi:hypothetical protein
MWFFLLFGGLAIRYTKLRRYPELKSVKFKQRIAYFKHLGMLCGNYSERCIKCRSIVARVAFLKIYTFCLPYFVRNQHVLLEAFSMGPNHSLWIDIPMILLCFSKCFKIHSFAKNDLFVSLEHLSGCNHGLHTSNASAQTGNRHR